MKDESTRVLPPSAESSQVARELYIDLLRKGLLGQLTQDYSTLPQEIWWKRFILSLVRASGYELVRPVQYSKLKEGDVWPKSAQTMIGEQRMLNIQTCLQKVIEDNVPGDVIETGVWRGGACIFMAGIIKAYGINDRTVWVADSFEGLPPATMEVDKKNIIPSYNWNNETLAVGMDDVKDNFSKYGLLDIHVKFLKGWFKDTLRQPPFHQLALARLDGDLYESTIDAIENLYPKLSVGGFLIVDDYGSWQTCQLAVDEYRKKMGITEEIIRIDKAGIYWRKERDI